MLARTAPASARSTTRRRSPRRTASCPSRSRGTATGVEIDLRRPLEEFRLAAARHAPRRSTRPRTSTRRRAAGTPPPPRPRPHLDHRRRPLPLRPHDPLRDPLPRHRHRHRRRRDVRGRRAGPARPLLGRAGLVGLWMVLVLHAPRRRHPGPPGRHPHDPGHAGLLRIHPDAGRRSIPLTALTVTEDLGDARLPIQGPHRDRRRLGAPARARPRPRRDAGRLRARAPAQRRRPHQPLPPGDGALPDRRRPHRSGWIEWNARPRPAAAGH